MKPVRLFVAAVTLLTLALPAAAQDKEKKEVISFSGSGDGPIKTIDKDGTVEETDASTLNNINVIPGFSGPQYTFDEPDRPRSRPVTPRRRSNATPDSNSDQAERIDEMLKNRKRHLRRTPGNNRPPDKR